MAPFLKILWFPTLLFFTFSQSLPAQVSIPHIEWAKSFGGSSIDLPQCIEQTVDKGYIIAGMSYSDDVDIAGHHGATDTWDYWIVKLDSNGNLEWQRSLGGNGNEIANNIKQTSDGGYIVAGSSDASGGDVSVNHGKEDYWIVKLDNNGAIIWQKSYGGSGSDKASCIELTSDGGYIVAGSSFSTDGDVTNHHGSTDSADYWIVKLNPAGKLEWQKSFGGTGDDEAYSIKEISHDGFIITGFSNSINGDITGNHGNEDYWIVKLDIAGNLIWQKSLGGSGTDVSYSIDVTADGGFVAAGYSNSNNGNVSDNHGQEDFWIAKLDSIGTLQWQKSLGGSQLDAAYSIRQTFDGGYIVAGNTASNDGDVSGNHGGKTGTNDFWVVKLNHEGSILWQKTLGGSDEDYALCIRQTSDSGYVITGSSLSSDSDVKVNRGFEDFWVVKLGFSSKSGVLQAEKSSHNTGRNYPNPFSRQTTILFNESLQSRSSLILYDLLGRQVQQILIPEGSTSLTLNRNELTSGVYVYRVVSEGAVFVTGNIIIQ